jgi:hypothetical protein
MALDIPLEGCPHREQCLSQDEANLLMALADIFADTHESFLVPAETYAALRRLDPLDLAHLLGHEAVDLMREGFRLFVPAVHGGPTGEG